MFPKTDTWDEKTFFYSIKLKVKTSFFLRKSTTSSLKAFILIDFLTLMHVAFHFHLKSISLIFQLLFTKNHHHYHNHNMARRQQQFHTHGGAIAINELIEKINITLHLYSPWST